MKTFKQRFHNF